MAHRIPVRKLKILHKDAEASATILHLRYVRSGEPGIERRGGPKRFRYLLNGRGLKDRRSMERIRSLTLPPAWSDVWICADDRGHLQATGYDTRRRKQYKYHVDWSRLRSTVKFAHMVEFGRCLPRLRSQLKADLREPGLPVNKVIATVLTVMERTHIRIGHEAYARENGSFGLSTLKDRHVRRTKNGLRFIFTGKRGIKHDIALDDRKLERIVLRCKELPGQDLFQYRDEGGEIRAITSTLVNERIRALCGGAFSSKDIRTWKGSLTALRALKGTAVPGTERERAMVVNQALDRVAEALGNTRAVCRRHYVYPGVLTAFEEGRLVTPRKASRTKGLTADEHLLMQLLVNQGGTKGMADAA